MLQTYSRLIISDNTDARRGKIIQVLGGSYKRFAFLAELVIIDVTMKKRIGARVLLRTELHPSVITQVRKKCLRLNGSLFKFFKNRSIILSFNAKHELESTATEFYGPYLREYQRILLDKTLLFISGDRRFLF